METKQKMMQFDQEQKKYFYLWLNFTKTAMVTGSILESRWLMFALYMEISCRTVKLWKRFIFKGDIYIDNLETEVSLYIYLHQTTLALCWLIKVSLLFILGNLKSLIEISLQKFWIAPFGKNFSKFLCIQFR